MKFYKSDVIEIPNIDTFKGYIPIGYDLVEYEKGTNPEMDGMVLHGFDEINMDEFGFKNPEYCFIKYIINKGKKQWT